MAQQYADNKEQVAERLIRLLSQGCDADDNYLEYAKQFYPKTAEAYHVMSVKPLPLGGGCKLRYNM